MRLAGEHEARVDLTLFQREMLVHRNAAADQFRATRPAHAALACVGRVGSHAQCRVEDSLSIVFNGKGRVAPVEDDRDLSGTRGRSHRRRLRGIADGALRVIRVEQLGMQVLRRNTAIEQHRSGGPQRNHSSTSSVGTS